MDPQDDDIFPAARLAPGYLANHAARVFNRMVDERLRPHGLTLSLIGPLLLLSWKGPLLQRDLVRSSAVKQPAMVALLGRLETMGLLSRSPSSTDRRAAMIDLTTAGREAARIGGDVLVAANLVGFAGFAPDEQVSLVTLLQKLIDNLEGGT